MRRTPVKIPILHETDTTQSFNDLGINSKTNIDDYDQKIALFFNIEAVTSYTLINEKGQEIECSMLHTSNDTFISPLSIDEIEHLII